MKKLFFISLLISSLCFQSSPVHAIANVPIMKEVLIDNGDNRAEFRIDLSQEADLVVYAIDQYTFVIDLLGEVYIDEATTYSSDTGLVEEASYESDIAGNIDQYQPVDLIVIKLRQPSQILDKQVSKNGALISFVSKPDDIVRKPVKKKKQFKYQENTNKNKRGLLHLMYESLYSKQDPISHIDRGMDFGQMAGLSKDKRTPETIDAMKMERYYDEAQNAEARGDIDLSIKYYGRMLHINPHHTTAKNHLKRLIRLQQGTDDEMSDISDLINPYENLKMDMIDDFDNENLTLKQCIAIALRNHIPIVIGKKQIEVAKSRVTQAKRSLFPDLTLESEFTGGINVQEEEFGGRRYKAELEHTVFDGGQASYSVRQNQFNVIVAEEDIRRLEAEQILKIKQNYYSLIRAKENIILQRRVMQLADEILKQVQELREEKVFTETDYLNFLSTYNGTAFSFTTANEDVEIAEFILKQNMGVRPDVPIGIETDYSFKRIDVDYDECIRLALKNRPEIGLNAALLKYYKYEMKIAKARGLPTITLTGNMGRGSETTADQKLKLADEWFVGSVIRVPFWGNTIEYQASKDRSGPTTSSFTSGAESVNNSVRFRLLDRLSGVVQSKEADAEYERQRKELAEAINNIILEIKEAYFSYKKSFMVMDASVIRIQSQEATKKLTTLRVHSGEAALPDLLGVETALASEKFSYIQAVTDYITTVATINKSIGINDYYNFDDKDTESEVKK